MEDVSDSKSESERSVGSTPITDTNKLKQKKMNIECKYCRHGWCTICAYYSPDNWDKDDEEDGDYDDIYDELDGLDIDDIM